MAARRIKLSKFAAVVLAICCLCSLVFACWSQNSKNSATVIYLRMRDFLVASNVSKSENLVCNIPRLDPFDAQISLEDHGKDVVKICTVDYQDNTSYVLVNNTFRLKDGVDKCRIDEKSFVLKEVVMIDDDHTKDSALPNPFKNGVEQSEDIGKNDIVRLDYKLDGIQRSDLYAHIVPQTETAAKQLELRKGGFAEKGIPTNVIILGFDSTSRANVERLLGGVLKLLRNELDTYFMDGMTIVGDATTPQLTALLTGKRQKDLPEARSSYGGTFVDRWPWIMKEYERQGYMTLFAEDDPWMGAFTLRLKGFKNKPTHHYIRPFWVGKKKGELRKRNICFKSQTVPNITFQYMLDFFDTYPTVPKFAFGFFCYLTHGKPERLSLHEHDLLNFFRALIARGYHENTTIIFMGDHGSRTSKFRSTMHGKLEERLPMFSISMPPSYKKRYPELRANLRANERVITSMFDVHATLRHILSYPEQPLSNYTSLFEKLPRNRTCPDAGIGEHFCTCLTWVKINSTSEVVQKTALAVVAYINKLLSKNEEIERSCRPLKLGAIMHAYTLDVGKLKFQKVENAGDPRYQVNIKTEPNKAEYEATASISKDGNVTVSSEISRLNLYGEQPKCIGGKYPDIRKYCFCGEK